MVEAVLFDLYGTLVHLARDRIPYMQLCRKVNCRKRLRESMIVESPQFVKIDAQPPKSAFVSVLTFGIRNYAVLKEYSDCLLYTSDAADE